MAALTHILTATDLSTPGTHAAQRAALLAQQSGARLDVLHVAQQAPMARLQQLVSTGALPANLDQRLLDSAQARLQELADLLAKEQGVKAGVKTAVGELLPTLQAEAESHQSSLIVLGAHGHSVVRHLLLGSTAERLLNHATRPMLLVRRAPRAAYRKVLIPVDLSPVSMRSIQLARTIAPKAQLCLLHAFDLPFEGSLRYAGIREDEIRHYIDAARAQAEQQLQALATSAGLAAHEAQTLVLYGDPSVRILQQEQELDADLIVMGKHGDNVLERLFVGSVTRHVLGDAQGDVLLSV